MEQMNQMNNFNFAIYLARSAFEYFFNIKYNIQYDSYTFFFPVCFCCFARFIYFFSEIQIFYLIVENGRKIYILNTNGILIFVKFENGYWE
jgi:hypothetical protein